MHRFAAKAWVCSLFLLALAFGCEKSPPKGEWEITVENKSDKPCSVFVGMSEGSSTAEIKDLAPGKKETMEVGEAETYIDSVRVVQGEKEEAVLFSKPLPVNKRFVITVNAEGKPEGVIQDK